MHETKDHIRKLLLAEGFDQVGFTVPDAVQEAGRGLSEFLDAGHHGEMAWLKERQHHRTHPKNLWPETKSAFEISKKIRSKLS